LSLSKTQINSSETIEAKITVTNTGAYDGEETVQLYIQDLVGDSNATCKRIERISKSSIAQGRKHGKVVFKISVNDLKFYNKEFEVCF
jgi:beta-glucosidase